MVVTQNNTFQGPEGDMKDKYEDMTFFQKNAVLSGVLSAATAAAVRRLENNEIDFSEQVDAVRVLEIVEEQRFFIKKQEHTLLDSNENIPSGSLDDYLESTNTSIDQQQADLMMLRQMRPDPYGRE